MLILENMMRLRQLDSYGYRFAPYPGALIVCSKSFGRRTIEIITAVEMPENAVQKRACLCNCNFTVGWVFKVQEDKLNDTSKLYTVMACQNENDYLLIEDVLASDWTIYPEFFPVVMVPYYLMSFLCCSGEQSGATGCSKRTSEETDVDSEEWRTSLRIVPWCGFGLPKWIKKNG